MRQDGASGEWSPGTTRLDGDAIGHAAGDLAELLLRCTAQDDADGASLAEARAAALAHWKEAERAAKEGRLVVLASSHGETILGAAQLLLAASRGPGPACRGEIVQLLACPSAPRHVTVPALLDRAEEEARGRGIRILTIELHAGDPDAALLRRRGFRLSGRIPGADARERDVLVFWKHPGGEAAQPLPAPPAREGVELVAHDRLFRSYLALDRLELRHRLHAGGTSGVIGRDLVVRGPAAAILLYDPDRGQVALVEQFRVGALAAGMDPWILETVAGVVEPGEEASEVAVREALEEAGARVEDIVHVARYLSSPGCSDETVDSFVGRVDASRLGGIHGLAEEGEDIRVVVMDVDDAIAACADGRVANAITLVALQWLALNRAALAARWRSA